MGRRSIFRIAIVVLAIVGFSAVPVSPFLSAQAADELEGMTLVTENEYLELYLNEATTEAAVRDKASGVVWRTNPLNDRRDAAKAQVAIKFYAPGSVESTMNSYTDSAAIGQFEIVPIDNGVRVDYTIGRLYDEYVLLPGLISASRVEEILARIEDDKARKNLESMIDRYFHLITLVPVENEEEKITYSASLKVFDGLRLEAEGKKLTTSQTNDILRNLLGRIAGGRLEYKEIIEVQRSDFEQVIGGKVYILDGKTPSFMLKNILTAFEEAGYTLEDRAIDNIENNLDPPRQRLEVFNVSLEYILDGHELVVRVPMDSVKFPENVVDLDGKYSPRNTVISLPISAIKVLPYFGAADTQASGYIFVPDGSGAIINLNSGKTQVSSFTSQVYGLNPALHQRAEKVTDTRQVHLPVYGMKQGDAAFLAIITEGDSLATIEASIASGSGAFNTVGANFVVRPATILSLTSDWQYSPQIGWGMLGKMSVLQSRMAREDIEIRYRFLHGEDADYVGMAHAYRDHLIGSGVGSVSRDQLDEGVPFIVGFLGATLKRTNILGIPRYVSIPLTTYDQVATVAGALQEAGVNNLAIRYAGWFNGSGNHDYPDRIRLIGVLGGEEAFGELCARSEANRWELYPDVAFVNVYRDRLFDGFRARSDSARTIDRKVTRSLVYDVPTFVAVEKESGYILSPGKLPGLISKFMSSFSRYGIGGLSLRDLGRDLSSDYRDDPERLIDRAQAQEIVTGQLARMADELSLGLMISGANSYALPFAKYVVDVPNDSSNYDIIDESVPFYQIALHGLVDFAGEAINLAPDPVEAILKTVEYGASLYFEWMYADSSEIKDTDHEDLYSLQYRDWFDIAVDLYKELRLIAEATRTQAIVDHCRVEEGVYRTQYEDGSAVIVNYNGYPVEVDGVTVDGLSYRLVERGAAQ